MTRNLDFICLPKPIFFFFNFHYRNFHYYFFSSLFFHCFAIWRTGDHSESILFLVFFSVHRDFSIFSVFLKILCTISCIIPTILQSYTDISNPYILAFSISQCELFSNEWKRSVLPPVLTSVCPWSWCWRQPQCIHCIVSVRVIARKLLKVHNKALHCINVCAQLQWRIRGLFIHYQSWLLKDSAFWTTLT